MMNEFTFIDLFAGIGGIRLAFQRVGGTCVFSSEFDGYAQMSYEAYYGEKPQGDITKIDCNEIPDHDILTGGFPCQAFSIIGLKKGFADTRGTLFFEIERILRSKKPKAFLLENVKQLTTHDQKRTFFTILRTLNDLGYYVHWKVLNALDFGLPQKRERVVIVGFRENYPFEFPEKHPVQPGLEGVLEDDSKVGVEHFVSEKIRNQTMQRVKEKGTKVFYPSVWHVNKSGNISVLPYSCALRAGASYNYLLVNGTRRPTPRENLRLQGFPDDFPLVVPPSQIRKQAGNAVPVNMIEAVARQMQTAMQREPLLSKNSREFVHSDRQLAFRI